ncbi:hypothetical protein THAOC_17273 [Thalassiosira oceanica]|uniref:Uncharacterized protein n=1 Tax=Thalassiosira oceanica TaxID=159749 RepID=K0SB34_THAOC|nr:hypothetical protein THAOC_17273 [Thalassiosira oceanica]|eukprot:EJK62129.1 hypothetical protein THAOC_17273 [Thalassiosira oceanica]
MFCHRGTIATKRRGAHQLLLHCVALAGGKQQDGAGGLQHTTGRAGAVGSEGGGVAVSRGGADAEKQTQMCCYAR